MAATHPGGSEMTSQGELSDPGEVSEDQWKYKKTPGFATTHGQEYEIKMAALLFLRGINSGRDFHMATNVQGAGALDDIVFKVKTSDQVWRTCFIQLKHKQAARLRRGMLLGPKGDFSLRKYYSSFVDIKESMSKENKEIMFDSSFDFSNFIIYTNASVHSELKNSKRVNEPSPLDDFVSSGVDTEYIFSVTEAADSDIYAALEADGANCRDFLRRLGIFTGEPTVKQLDDVIKKELREYCRNQGVEYFDLMYSKCEEAFKTWWEDSSGALLHHNSPILNHALKEARDEKHSLVSEEIVEKLTKEQAEKFALDIKFLESSTASLKDACADQHSLVNVEAQESVRITTNRVMQFLEARKDPCIIMGTECLLKQRQAVMSSWRHGKKHLLVIVSEATANQVMDDICTEISQVLQESKDKWIILVSPPSNSFARRLEVKMGTNFTSLTDSFHLEQLHPESIVSLLQKEVVLQGTPTTLGSMIGEDLDRITKELKDVLETIIASESLFIGGNMQDDIEYYVPRTMQCKNIVSNIIFTDKTYAGRIIIHGALLGDVDYLIPNRELRIRHKFQQISEGLEFNAFDNEDNERDANTRNDVHYFDWFEGKLVYKETRGNINFIKKYIDESRSNTIREPYSRVVLLIAEPGMGKSTLLTHEAQQVRVANPGSWVVCVALNDHATLLAKVKKGDLKAEQFLSSALGLDTVLERALFSYSMNHTGRITALLDAFDEISPRYTDECLTLINNVLNTRIDKIWISSRFSMKNKLETRLSTLALTLRKFTIEDQRLFLERYWKASTCHSSEVIQEYISKLFIITAQSMNDHERDLTGIPLQTRMLAEVFQDSITNVQTIILPTSLHVLQLIEKFVWKKIETYFKKIINQDESGAEYEYQFEEQREMFITKHITASLIVLFDESDLQSLHSLDVRKSDIFIANIEKGIDKTGIIDRVVDGKPVFLHRVFAEYFAALWFSEHYQSCSEFMSKHLLSETFGVVRHMFDRILARDNDLHNAVLNSDEARVKALLEGGTDVNTTDKGGRTALHLCVVAGLHNTSEDKPNIPVIQLLMSHNGLKDVKDKVLQWTPMQYADASKLWAEIDTLLAEACGDISQFIITKRNICDEDMWENIVKQDYANVLYLLSQIFQSCSLLEKIRFKLSNTDISEFMKPESLLLKSAKYGSAEVARQLIGRTSGITSRKTNQKDVNTVTETTGSSRKMSWFNRRALKKLLNARGGRYNRNALMISSEHNFMLVVKIILESFDEHEDLAEYVNALDDYGRSALWLASRWGHNDICDLLIASNADVTTRDKYALTTGLTEASREGHMSVVKSLLTAFNDEDKKAEYVNTCNDKGESAFWLASSRGHNVICGTLIAHGADITARDKFGLTTGLMEASRAGHMSVVKSLLASFNDESKKAEYVNACNGRGESALWLASSKGHNIICDLLIAHGADVTARDKFGLTTGLMAALRAGHMSVIKSLLGAFHDESKKAEYVNTCNKWGESALWLASSKGHNAICDLLIAHGADVTAKENYALTTGLMAASRAGHMSVVKSLLATFDDEIKKAEYVNTCNRWGESALWLAGTGRHNDIIDLLRPYKRYKV